MYLAHCHPPRFGDKMDAMPEVSLLKDVVRTGWGRRREGSMTNMPCGIWKWHGWSA